MDTDSMLFRIPAFSETSFKLETILISHYRKIQENHSSLVKNASETKRSPSISPQSVFSSVTFRFFKKSMGKLNGAGS